MMASVATSLPAARGGHASVFGQEAGQHVATWPHWPMATPASVATVATPVATTPAGQPAPHRWPAAPFLASGHGKIVTTGQEGRT